jgi:general secretion pathway protein G
MRKEPDRGFTLIELIVALGILATLTTLAIPTFINYMDKSRNIQAISVIHGLEKDIELFEYKDGSFPDSLTEIGQGNLLDPWGHPYQYLNFATAGKSGEKKIRKDKSLHPLNSYYDLYSMGKDGNSKTPLTAKDSRDDIIRANDGEYVGLASDY